MLVTAEAKMRAGSLRAGIPSAWDNRFGGPGVGPASTRPSIITLTCADAGIGVQDMTWATWTSSGATGHGLLWLNLCKPDCAAGKFARYPVRVALSDVQASAHGSGSGT